MVGMPGAAMRNTTRSSNPSSPLASCIVASWAMVVEAGVGDGPLILSWGPDAASPLAVPSDKPQKMPLPKPDSGARVNQERESIWKLQNVETLRSAS